MGLRGTAIEVWCNEVLDSVTESAEGVVLDTLDLATEGAALDKPLLKLLC